jgi:hypothetical protein
MTNIPFHSFIAMLIISMVLFSQEIRIANVTLDVHLSDTKEHQDWWQYLKPKQKRRVRAEKQPDNITVR